MKKRKTFFLIPGDNTVMKEATNNNELPETATNSDKGSCPARCDQG